MRRNYQYVETVDFWNQELLRNLMEWYKVAEEHHLIWVEEGPPVVCDSCDVNIGLTKTCSEVL